MYCNCNNPKRKQLCVRRFYLLHDLDLNNSQFLNFALVYKDEEICETAYSYKKSNKLC